MGCIIPLIKIKKQAVGWEKHKRFPPFLKSVIARNECNIAIYTHPHQASPASPLKGSSDRMCQISVADVKSISCSHLFLKSVIARNECNITIYTHPHLASPASPFKGRSDGMCQISVADGKSVSGSHLFT